MMDNEKIFKRLAHAAAAERAPLVDITSRVMQTIRTPARAVTPLALWVFSGAATAAAAAVLIIAVTIGNNPQPGGDVMADLARTMSVGALQ